MIFSVSVRRHRLTLTRGRALRRPGGRTLRGCWAWPCGSACPAAATPREAPRSLASVGAPLWSSSSRSSAGGEVIAARSLAVRARRRCSCRGCPSSSVVQAIRHAGAVARADPDRHGAAAVRPARARAPRRAVQRPSCASARCSSSPAASLLAGEAPAAALPRSSARVLALLCAAALRGAATTSPAGLRGSRIRRRSSRRRRRSRARPRWCSRGSSLAAPAHCAGACRPGRHGLRRSPASASGSAYSSLIAALDRGRVSVVAPLNATQSLWAVVLRRRVLRQSEAIGRRVTSAAVLVVAGALVDFAGSGMSRYRALTRAAIASPTSGVVGARRRCRAFAGRRGRHPRARSYASRRLRLAEMLEHQHGAPDRAARGSRCPVRRCPAPSRAPARTCPARPIPARRWRSRPCPCRPGSRPRGR